MLVKRRCQVHLMMMNSHDSTGERPRQPLARLVPNPKLKFMEQCREVMRFKQLAHRTEAILFCRTKNLNNQLSTLFAPAGEGCGFRTKSNRRAWRQGGQRSRDDFAGPPEGGTPNAFAECARRAGLTRIPKLKTDAMVCFGEHTPRACGFRRRAENIVRQTFPFRKFPEACVTKVRARRPNLHAGRARSPSQLWFSG